MVGNHCLILQERVNVARKIEKIEYFNCRKQHHNSWFRQAAEEMDIDLDDDLLLGKYCSSVKLFCSDGAVLIVL